MIREFNVKDIDILMKIWLDENLNTHYFIDKNYFYENFKYVKDSILHSEIFVYEEDNIIKGFIGIVDNYVAGIFVDSKYQSQKIGQQLLKFAKEKYGYLNLSVYQKNQKAITFYLNNEFMVTNQTLDQTNNEYELYMEWANETFIN